ncbi:aminotransferase class IV family protein [Alloyangia pacifica]|uniref:Probable branched-chain-amino-acid aminotransferase n=1 Tax=Alloyangia pacifica TaxID=311180 RepID=A0A1I6W2I0_9RHOB|nr:aminotransferase class IV family protein [Alloyangia pacifica]SDI37274.1 4-amino-4-deoxychorismate lyase [Alloyangia pacifica]SFT19854.1 4-amino-4-deoxychorismate lyase [Alloyangia pacifica]
MESPIPDRIDAAGLSPDLRLIETLRWEPGEGPIRGERHLARCLRSCAALGIPLQRAALEAALAGFRADGPQRLRLTVGRAGDIEITSAPFDPASVLAGTRVMLCAARLDAGEALLRHKTTARALYDAALKARPEGIDELLFLNTRGELCEGAYTNVFLEREDGVRVTPALSSGLLPGVLRETQLEEGAFVEAVVHLADLQNARRLWIGNALRGLMTAELRPGEVPVSL